MKTPRVAWLLNSCFFYWHPLLSEFSRLFPETMVYTSWWRGFTPGYEDSFQVEVLGEQKVIPLAKSRTGGYGLNLTYLPLNVVNRLLAYRPNVVISNAFGIWTILAAIFKPLGRWRLVIAYEGSSPEVDFRNSAPRLALRRILVQQADACITNSRAGRDYLITLLGADPERVLMHPYEVPELEVLTAGIQPVPALDEGVRPLLLFVGGLSHRKGVDLLLKACAQLEGRGCKRYTLVIVGDGSERQSLEAFCQEAGLGERVRWIGSVPYGQLGSYFSQADLFVLPTREDTWGVVVLEAMVLGKPVLCSKWAGTSELINNGEEGYLVDPLDIEALADSLQRCIEDPEALARMGEGARQRIAPFTPRAAAEQLAKLIEII